jgi:hypothetical protein
MVVFLVDLEWYFGYIIMALWWFLWGDFLSLYSRFYEVTISESTYAINEGKNASVFLDVKLRL